MEIINNNNNDAILFLHGGPGLDSSYLRSWFNSLTTTHNLVFYDQDYKKAEKSMIDHLCLQLITLLQSLSHDYESITVYAHSWGSYLFLNTLSKYDESQSMVNRVIFSNPSATSWKGFMESGDRLFSKMPQDILNEISSCSDGVKLMKIALPYYVGNANNVPEIPFAKYDLDAYSVAEKEMENYDISKLVGLLDSNKTFTIYCENDFEDISGSPEFNNFSKVIKFSDTGHFPFAERQADYIDLLRSILKDEL